MRELPVCLSAGKGAEQIQQIPTSCILRVCFDGTDAWWGRFIRVQNWHVQTLNYKLEHCYVCWSQLEFFQAEMCCRQRICTEGKLNWQWSQRGQCKKCVMWERCQKEEKKKKAPDWVCVFMLTHSHYNNEGQRWFITLSWLSACQLFGSCHLLQSDAACSGGQQPDTEPSVPAGFHPSALSEPQLVAPSDPPVLHSDLHPA